MNKTYGTQLEKQGQTDQGLLHLDSSVLANQQKFIFICSVHTLNDFMKSDNWWE